MDTLSSQEKNAQAEQRAQKKAARRAAFIQEVANAVALRLGQAVPVEVVLSRNTLHGAGALAVALGRTAHNIPAPAAKQVSPFEAEHLQARKERFEAEEVQRATEFKQRRIKQVLEWAIYNKLLPASATELPSEEVQRYLLTTTP